MALRTDDYWTGQVKQSIYRASKQAIKDLDPSRVKVGVIQRLYEDLYVANTVPAAQASYYKLVGRKSIPVPYGDPEVIDWEQLVLSYVGSAPLATRIVGVTQNTQEIIQRIILRSIDEGLSIEQTQRALRTYFTSNNLLSELPLSVRRARVIARTEIGTALESGNFLGAQKLALEGYNVTKTWLTRLDGRERDSHAAANGQTVGINQPFIVGGARMMHPNEAGAPAEEVIQCRCSVTFAIE